MAVIDGTASGASSTPGQGQSGEETAWRQEKQRLESELASRDQQIRATTQKLQAWEQNVGKELEGHLEFDNYGRPVRVRVDDQGVTPVFQGTHPLTGLVENPEVVDQYYGNRFSTPQQLQQMVTQAKQEAYFAARGDFLTLRAVDKTVSDPRYKELSSFESPLSKRTAEVLQRNGWGQPSDPSSKSWDSFRYADPTALPLAVQIAKAELFEQSQGSQEAQTQAQQSQAAAGIAGTGSAAGAATTTRTPEDMAKLFSENPTEYNRIMKENFDRAVAGSGH